MFAAGALLATLTACGQAAAPSGSAASPGGPSAAAATPLPWTATPLAQCSPTPCATYGGVALHIVSVDRDLEPWTNGFDVVRLTVSFSVVSGEESIDPFTTLALRDPLGTWQQTDFWPYGEPPPGCASLAQEAAYPATLAPGASAGPLPVCFEAAGSTSASLLVAWGPDELQSSTPGNILPTSLCTNELSDANIPATYSASASGVLFTGKFTDVGMTCEAILIQV